MDFVNWLLFYVWGKNSSRIFFLRLFYDLLFNLRFDYDEMSLKCISRVLRKFFFMHLLTFVPFLYKDLSVLHEFVSSTVKTSVVIKSDYFKLILHTIHSFSFNSTCFIFSLIEKSAISKTSAISLLLVLVEVSNPIGFNISKVHCTKPMTTITEVFADVHFVIICFD